MKTFSIREMREALQRGCHAEASVSHVPFRSAGAALPLKPRPYCLTSSPVLLFPRSGGPKVAGSCLFEN